MGDFVLLGTYFIQLMGPLGRMGIKSNFIITVIYLLNYSRCSFPMKVKWVNDGLLQSNDGKMLVNDGELLVNDGEMSM